MHIYDIGLAWNWEFDCHFIHGIEQECHKLGLRTFRIEPHNVAEVIKLIKAEKIFFRTFLDRASDADDAFIPLAKLISISSSHIFNLYEWMEYAKDKANMHIALLGEGVHVPYTIIVSPYNKKKELELSLTELQHLGRPFIIKPANTTGGGIGVVLGAETLKEILENRQRHENDIYLLQETIVPKYLEKNKAWFRVFYAFGETIACWWDDKTHIYKRITEEEKREFQLHMFTAIIKKMHEICKLDFFSTEIALTENNTFVAVDYINEICDMREQSRHIDGVPDDVILQIQRNLAMRVKSLSQKPA
jgi:hypothetical protein